MNEVFRGRGLLRAVVLIPWAIPTVVSSQMWRFIFNDRYGLFNFVLFGGDASRYLAPLADPILAPLTIIVAEVWKTAPFVALIVLAGLQTIPDELYEAASIDGATAWQQFRHVTLPLIRPALLLALLFRTIDALRVFDLVFVMTQGGPADATNVLSFLRLQKNLRGRHGRLRLRHRGGGFSSLLDPLPRLSADSQVQPFGRDAAMKRAAMLAIFSVGIGIYCLIPYLWFALTSWKSPAELTAIPPQLIPSFHWDFYRSALEERGLLRYIANSIIVAGTATGITIAIGSVAAYALARFQLPWTNAYLLLLLAISMFPQIAIAGPVWNLLNHLDWLNTYRGLVAAYIALSLPLATWILTTFFREVPHEIEEAALIDGCSRFQAFYKIVLPIAAPGIFTAALLVFIYAWNEFFFALIVLTDPNLQTLPVGIALFPGEYTMPWGEIAAASTLATLPLIVLTLLFQRGIVRGLAAGAVKG